jgi:beta-glucosidase
VATSSYQVEGAVAEDRRGPSIWDVFSHTPGKVFHGDTGDVAADQYHRYEADVRHMAELGIQAYRFSIAWPRIQPEGKGRVNRAGLDYYRRLVDTLLSHSVTPAVTLYHWDLPQGLQDRGGWTSRDTARRFADYAAILFEDLHDRVPLWMTLNEPWVSAWMGHATGEHAPGLTDRDKALRATHHLLLGHGLALEAMRSGGSDAQAGIALNLTPVRPARGTAADLDAAERVDAFLNRLYLAPLFSGSYPQGLLEWYGAAMPIEEGDMALIAQPVDFLGVNYYTCHRVEALAHDGPRLDGDLYAGLGARPVRDTGARRTAMGWAIEPDGLRELLVRLRRELASVPLYITENGAAFHDYGDPEGRVKDTERVDYLAAHLRAAREAIEDGVDLRGYFLWSLLDNFEWAEGYSKRFGILYVDFPTQRRTFKDSAHWYAEVIRRNGVSAP